ncbi:Dak1p [Sugiyamaella lignohabitans]|uniref:Dak1p n=1 Tax=Sugiyamaella lignohabitans TaxID=796027 RepID=A0A167CGZ2_9ASCO|nr:Dak1p [Sugiyamaella lignohabitans]ANB11682.1 Dak1p [Sugiyamaella lignohabitans]
MSKKHFFSDGNGLVVKALENLVNANPYLDFIPSEKVIYNPYHSKDKVSIISGGGSGHEPAWSSYVGNGMLTAAVNGDIFASPSAKQVLSAIKVSPSEKGVILVITNYTGDKLHFGLACEKAKALSLIPSNAKIALLPITDDATLPKGSASIDTVGRRGLAGNVLVLKVLGAYADSGKSFDECMDLGRSMNANTVTSGSSLDHCHVPGRSSHEEIPLDSCVLGMGIHNEKGLKQLTPIPQPEELVGMMINFLVDPADTTRSFVKFQPNDWVILLVNNFGGLSELELSSLSRVATQVLNDKWNITPKRILSGTFETSLNGPGFSISLCNISNVARETKLSEQYIFDLLNERCSVPGWPQYVANDYKDLSRTVSEVDGISESNADSHEKTTLVMDKERLKNIISHACQRAIDKEPKLTEWDTIMGDGDCGIAVKETSEKVLQLDDKVFSSNNVLEVLGHLIDILDDMGGSLGAILCIWLSSFTAYLSQHKLNADGLDIKLNAAAAESAMNSLYQYTSARSGDRTVMDTLIPFCAELAKTHDLKKACEVARQAAENTANLKAKFGRATYVVSAEKVQDPVPDPGAWAVYELIQGITDLV